MAQILAVYRRHGFVRIETPAVESLRLLLRQRRRREREADLQDPQARGEARGGAAAPEDLADLGLRFDLTVPLARYYAHNHAKLPQPLKAIQIGPVWRAERPQQGRYRQFTQCDIDVLGRRVRGRRDRADPRHHRGARRARAQGPDGPDQRPPPPRAPWSPTAGSIRGGRARVFIALDKLDKIGRDGVAAELREAGHPDAAVDRMLELFASTARRTSRRALRALLGARVDGGACGAACAHPRHGRGAGGRGRFGIAFDATLVRGMGYYTGPIFEMQHGERAPRRSRAAGATIGWSASSSGGTSRPPASRSASSA